MLQESESDVREIWRSLRGLFANWRGEDLTELPGSRLRGNYARKSVPPAQTERGRLFLGAERGRWIDRNP